MPTSMPRPVTNVLEYRLAVAKMAIFRRLPTLRPPARGTPRAGLRHSLLVNRGNQCVGLDDEQFSLALVDRLTIERHAFQHVDHLLRDLVARIGQFSQCRLQLGISRVIAVERGGGDRKSLTAKAADGRIDVLIGLRQTRDDVAVALLPLKHRVALKYFE